MTLIFFTLAVLMGVVAARQGTPSLPALLAGDAAVALFAAWAWRADRARQVAVICAGLAIGATRCAIGVPRIDAGHVAAYNDSGNVTLRAWVAEQPDIRGARTLLTVEALALDRGGEELPVRGRVVANVFSWPSTEYGDILEIEGALQTPPEDEEFSYRQYLAERGVLAWMPRARVRVVGVRSGLLVATRRAGGRLKAYLRGVINSILPNPEAGLLNGITGCGLAVEREEVERIKG